MSAIEATLILASLIAVAAFWFAPRGTGQNVVAATTAVTLSLVAPISAIWLLGSIAMIPPLMRLGERTNRRGAVVIVGAVFLTVILLGAREFTDWHGRTIALVGGAYFTLRHIHVLMEWWLGRLTVPSFGAYARYQLFLPVLMAGPIHRLPNFERQCARRRWSTGEFFSGAERALFGLALAVVVGEFGFYRLRIAMTPLLHELAPFPAEWVSSAVDWMLIYVQFSGFTDLALGLSLMMGLKLEENFDRPWRARNLIEFWSRWHMTLTHWARDYVYVPIAAHFRAPVIGAGAAMLAIGLWHATSVYYVFWAFWQALGIVLTQVYLNTDDPIGLGRLPPAGKAVFGPLAVLAWISAPRPIFESVSAMIGL